MPIYSERKKEMFVKVNNLVKEKKYTKEQICAIVEDLTGFSYDTIKKYIDKRISLNLIKKDEKGVLF